MKYRKIRFAEANISNVLSLHILDSNSILSRKSIVLLG